MLAAEALFNNTNVLHGFHTRTGGVSEGIYASLNCGLGSGDNQNHVRRNRAIALKRFGFSEDRLVTVRQVHSATVVVASAPWSDENRPAADGIVSSSRGIALGILTADCAPVLLADPDAGVIAAAHAGWRGARSGVLEATLAAMQQLGARSENTRCVVGPCIQQASYEVGPEFRNGFVNEDSDADRFFVLSDRPDHHRFNLPAYVESRLSAMGVAAVAVLNEDTCVDTERFFSFRRATKRGEPDYGRQLSMIALAE